MSTSESLRANADLHEAGTPTFAAALLRQPASELDALNGTLTWELCHCGEPIIADLFDSDKGWHSRGLCAHCSSVRCDAFPGDCNR